MFRPLELFIGTRYIRAKRRNHFISFISVVSMLGLIIGITALITVINAVMPMIRPSIDTTLMKEMKWLRRLARM